MKDSSYETLWGNNLSIRGGGGGTISTRNGSFPTYSRVHNAQSPGLQMMQQMQMLMESQPVLPSDKMFSAFMGGILLASAVFTTRMMQVLGEEGSTVILIMGNPKQVPLI